VERDLFAAAASGEGTVRCFACRNRLGLAGAFVLQSGVVCCRRCGEGATPVAPTPRRAPVELGA
jgi:hypothetical protein